jgi:hypothetical protein
MNWWLRSDKGGHAIDEVRDALDLLLDKGELEEVKSQQDIFIHYCPVIEQRETDKLLKYKK